MMVTSSEAHEAALVLYNAVKGAHRSNVAGTQDIFKDLKQQFPRKRRNTETTGTHTDIIINKKDISPNKKNIIIAQKGMLTNKKNIPFNYKTIMIFF